MAKRAFHATSFTPTAVADTTAMANGTYMAIGASGATAGLEVKGIRISGQGTGPSNLCIMQFARDSALGITPTALAAPNSDGPLDGRTAALAAVPITYVAAGTGPARSALTTAARLDLGFNAFGGLARWDGFDGCGWGITGVTASLSESSLSAFTGGNVAPIAATIIYEPL